MTDNLTITGITIEADSVVIKGSDFDALCAIAREDKQIRECLAEALGNYARLRAALERIKQVRYGLEQNATDEERAAYWGDMALAYRQIASDALRGSEPQEACPAAARDDSVIQK